MGHTRTTHRAAIGSLKKSNHPCGQSTVKPKSKAEALARSNGFEYRHVYAQGVGAARGARHATRRASNKAMRTHGRRMVIEGLTN